MWVLWCVWHKDNTYKRRLSMHTKSSPKSFRASKRQYGRVFCSSFFWFSGKVLGSQISLWASPSKHTGVFLSTPRCGTDCLFCLFIVNKITWADSCHKKVRVAPKDSGSLRLCPLGTAPLSRSSPSSTNSKTCLFSPLMKKNRDFVSITFVFFPISQHALARLRSGGSSLETGWGRGGKKISFLTGITIWRVGRGRIRNKNGGLYARLHPITWLESLRDGSGGSQIMTNLLNLNVQVFPGIITLVL